MSKIWQFWFQTVRYVTWLSSHSKSGKFKVWMFPDFWNPVFSYLLQSFYSPLFGVILTWIFQKRDLNYLSLLYARQEIYSFHDFQMIFIVFDHANACSSMHLLVEIHKTQVLPKHSTPQKIEGKFLIFLQNLSRWSPNSQKLGNTVICLQLFLR